MSAGELREKLSFEARISSDDEYGNPTAGEFTEQFEVSARIQPLKGGEGVIAARLTGVQPVIIRVRYSSDTAMIEAGWRAIDTRNNKVYAITAPPINVDERRRYLDILATLGVAS